MIIIKYLLKFLWGSAFRVDADRRILNDFSYSRNNNVSSSNYDVVGKNWNQHHRRLNSIVVDGQDIHKKDNKNLDFVAGGGTDDLTADVGVELQVRREKVEEDGIQQQQEEAAFSKLEPEDMMNDDEVLMKKNYDKIHDRSGNKINNVFDYGSAEFTLHELEDKLDIDLLSLQKELRDTPEQTDRTNAVSQHLKRVMNDVSELYNSISVTEQELHKALNDLMDKDRWIKKHDLEEEFERLIDLVHSGKVGVDYKTGKLLAKKDRRGEESKSMDNPLLAVSSGDSETVEEQVMDLERSLESANAQQNNEFLVPNFERRTHTQFAHKMMSKLLKEVQELKEDEDPAVLQLDLNLLKDIVTLAITAAFCGMVAVTLKLPATAGFLFGGMIIGPSCLNIILCVKQVQTLAQFGSIFFLFEQGLLYSRIYSPTQDDESSCNQNDSELENEQNNKRVSNANNEKKRDINNVGAFQDHDPNIIGAFILLILIVSGMTLFALINYTHSFREAAILATTISICSTTVVSDNLHSSRLAETQWGKQLLKMIAMQDLFMIPLLTLPEMIETRRQNGFILSRHIVTYIIPSLLFVAGAITLSHYIINFAVSINKNKNDELFSLSVVAYALMMATISEELGLSIEAGAIFSGLVLIRSPHVPKVVNSISSLSRVFGGMYLTSLGMIISPHFVMEKKSSIINLVGFIGVFKAGVVFLILHQILKCDRLMAVSAGVSMAQISEGSLVVLARASRLGFLKRTTYLTLIPTTFILLALAPFSTILFNQLRHSNDAKKSNDIVGFTYLRSKIPPLLALRRRQTSLPSNHHPKR